MGNRTSGAERRRHARYERDDLGLVVTSVRSGSIPDEPWLSDISSAGMGLQVGTEVKPGDTFDFRLDLPSGHVTGRASVRWASPHGVGYRCGVEVTGVPWLAARRLRLYLEPDQFDLFKALDQTFLLAVAVVAALVVLDVFSVNLRGLWETVRFFFAKW